MTYRGIQLTIALILLGDELEVEYLEEQQMIMAERIGLKILLYIRCIAACLPFMGGMELIAQECVPTDNYITQQPLPLTAGSSLISVVALGTSLTWGDGLRQTETYRYLVADWLAAQTARPVQLTTFAHSMAILGDPPQGISVPPNPAPQIGDINSYVPNLDDQITCATTKYALSNADLVILDGCINEVDAVLIVAPWEPTTTLKENTETYCRTGMQATLDKVKASFPSAIVVLVGYYPLITPKSSVFGFGGSHRLASYAKKEYRMQHSDFKVPSDTHFSRKAEHNIMIENSRVFYQTSKQDFIDDIKTENGSRAGRFFFAKLPEMQIGNESTVDPDWAYGAPKTHLWMLPLNIFGLVFYKDDKYWFRYHLCEKYIVNLGDPFVCESNAGFHPKPVGAATYAQSIESVIPSASIKTWRNK
jgi:hypothetical protein